MWTNTNIELNYSSSITGTNSYIKSKYTEPYFNYWITDTQPKHILDYDNSTAIGNSWYKTYIPTPDVSLRDIIRSRVSPAILVRRRGVSLSPDIREQRARDTLRKVIGEDRFRRFCKDGHITVRAKSGLIYQVFPGHGITCVFDKGRMIDRLCVVLSGNFPATDSLIMRYLLILNDEAQFRSLAIRHGIVMDIKLHDLDVQPKLLTEIFAEIKSRAA